MQKNKVVSQIHSSVYRFNVCFIRLEKLVYKNNLVIIYTTWQSSIQYTTLNQLNITKQTFLNIYHFPSTLVLLKYQDPFIEYPIFESCLSCSFSCLSSEFQHYSLCLTELQVCSYYLNIGQDQLNVASTM